MVILIVIVIIFVNTCELVIVDSGFIISVMAFIIGITSITEIIGSTMTSSFFMICGTTDHVRRCAGELQWEGGDRKETTRIMPVVLIVAVITTIIVISSGIVNAISVIDSTPPSSF